MDRTSFIRRCDSGTYDCVSGVDLCQCESVGARLGVSEMWVGLTRIEQRDLLMR
ncbi:hypothetical protein [Acetobacter ascendens]|uniref:hypothetical protein n=1 Tax=Acetobacter ascendens TaxID=481146 RepID=UPI00030C0DDC|nr:hypothetical protein [Acetobacter ascendens]